MSAPHVEIHDYRTPAQRRLHRTFTSSPYGASYRRSGGRRTKRENVARKQLREAVGVVAFVVVGYIGMVIALAGFGA